MHLLYKFELEKCKPCHHKVLIMNLMKIYRSSVRNARPRIKYFSITLQRSPLNKFSIESHFRSNYTLSHRSTKGIFSPRPIINQKTISSELARKTFKNHLRTLGSMQKRKNAHCSYRSKRCEKSIFIKPYQKPAIASGLKPRAKYTKWKKST